LSSIAGRITAVRERMAAAEARAGRAPGAATLVAVGKTFPAAALQEAVDAGATVLGENRVQEALEKAPEVSGATWHLVGHLQRNKARRAVEVFHLLHALDSPRLAGRLAELGAERGEPVRTLVQVNLSREASKAGVFEEDLPGFLDLCAGLDGLSIEGLMTIPAPPERPEDSRGAFARLRRLAEAERARHRSGMPLDELSMGMTGDFEVAIEEGATLVRVGRALFGERG
jgi:pyridoxal phosphate enzyme (YggS family)